MKLELFYPIKPYLITQKWGIKDDFYKKFGFSQHNGVDIQNFGKLYSEIECEYYRTLWQPNGGGLTLGVLSLHTYDFPDGKYRILIDYLHLDKVVLKVGQKVKVGELIAIPDNTGVTTGPHCHIQYRRVKVDDKGVVTNADKNQANGSFDPEPYRNGWYAQEFRLLYDQSVSLWERLQAFINSLARNKKAGII